MCKVKKCKDCNAKRPIHLFLSADGTTHVNRCQRCRNKRINKSRRKLKAKRDTIFGGDWEERVSTGDYQCCKRCESVKPINDFQRKTESGISVCFGCANTSPYSINRLVPLGKVLCNRCEAVKEENEFTKVSQRGTGTCRGCNSELRRKRYHEKEIEELLSSGNKKSCNLSYIKCIVCDKKDAIRPNRTYHVKGMCYTCGKNRKDSSGLSRAEAQKARQKSIDYKRKIKFCKQCNTEKTFSEFDIKSYNGMPSGCCKTCKRAKTAERDAIRFGFSSAAERTRKHKLSMLIVEAKEFFNARQERIDSIGKSSPLEYICCLACGGEETKIAGQVYHVKGCCKRCGYNIKKAIQYYEQEYEGFDPIKSCEDCHKQYYVGIGDRSTKCPKCYRAHKRRLKRSHSLFRRNAKRVARNDGIRYDPYDIFKRDKWRCKLCGTKVHKRSTLLPDSAEVDHIVPLSMGGRDIPSNVQCSCRQCNGDKGASIAGQISLFALTRERAGAG